MTGLMGGPVGRDRPGDMGGRLPPMGLGTPEGPLYIED